MTKQAMLTLLAWGSTQSQATQTAFVDFFKDRMSESAIITYNHICGALQDFDGTMLN